MTRKTLTVEQLENAGYEAFEFGDYTLDDAVNYIRSGCETRLEPRAGGFMVAIVIIRINGYKYEKEMFTRAMTDKEKNVYKQEMEDQERRNEKVSAKIRAKNIARMRRH